MDTYMAEFPQDDIDNVITHLENNHFVIFGMGRIAQLFYKRCEYYDINKNIIAFTKTNCKYLGDTFYNKPVLPFKFIPKNTLIIIAVHDIYVHDVIDILSTNGFHNYLWIYYYLFDFLYGKPIRVNTRINIEILEHNIKSSNSFYACMYAIDDYVHNRTAGILHYKEHMNRIGSNEMANLRWERFKKKIDEVQVNGFKDDYNIKVSKDLLYIIDGMHRFSLADYFKKEYIIADIYNCEKKMPLFIWDKKYTENNYELLDDIKKRGRI